MHDGIELERRGIAAAALVTERFVPTAVAMTKIDGIPDYPFLVVPHPLSSLTADELRERAMRLAPAIVRVLLSGEKIVLTS